MSAPGAADRVHRLLSLIPWLEQNHPSGADIGEVATMYGYPPADLVRDLKIGRAHVGTPVTSLPRMPSSA